MELTLEALEQHWLPFTNNRDFKREPRLFVRASGMYYWSQRGEKILDGSSGLFTSAAGHCRPEIAAAVAEQLQTLDFSPSFMRGHPGAFALANGIAALTPQDLNHIFFCNSGSEAIDTAIKIAFAYHLARKEAQRTYLVSRERAYHGVNIGGTALSGIVRNREAFGALMPGVLHLRHTLLPENRFTRGMGAHGAELADDLLRFVQLVGEKRIAAVFVEPIAGSTGVLVPPRGYLERIRAICDRYGILLVFDEVICGFGRTGEPFAALSFGVTPDIITMAKARLWMPRRTVPPNSSTATPTLRTRRPAPPDLRRSRSTRPSAYLLRAASCRTTSRMRCLRCRSCRSWQTYAVRACWRAWKSNPARRRVCAAPSCKRSSLIAACTSRRRATSQSLHPHLLPAVPRSTR